MTVGDLIKTLQSFPDDLEVYKDSGEELDEVTHFKPDEEEKAGGWTE